MDYISVFMTERQIWNFNGVAAENLSSMESITIPHIEHLMAYLLFSPTSLYGKRFPMPGTSPVFL
jgi:hypothetical protein